MNFNLREIRFISFTVKGIRVVSTFFMPEGAYHGHFVVFEEYQPKYVYVGSDNIEVQKEIDYFFVKHSLNYSKFIGNILSYSSRLSLIPKNKSKSMIYFQETGRRQAFDLDFLDIEPFWIKLTSKDIEKIVSKSRHQLFDFIKGY